MTGLAVYTTDYTPRLVYSEDGADERDRELVERVVRYGDAPLDLLVDFGSEGTRVLWSFQGKLGSAANRTESFVAEFLVPADVDPFEAFEAALEAAEGDVQLAEDGGSHQGFGLELANTEAGTPGLSPPRRRRLFERLERGVDSVEPLAFGLRGYESARAVVRAIEAADIGCRVAVASGGDPASLEGVDLVLVVGADEEWTPLSEAAASVLGTSEVGTIRTDDPEETTRDERRTSAEGSRRTERLPVAVAVTVVVLYLGGAVVLYRGNAGLVPLATGTVAGVVATGFVLGAERLAGRHRWLAGTVLALLVVGGFVAGVVALLHAVGIVQRGFLATVVAGGYLGFVASFGLYVAGTAIVSGRTAVVPGLRSLVGVPLRRR